MVLAFHFRLFFFLHSNLYKIGVVLHNYNCGAKLKRNCANLQLLGSNYKKLKTKGLVVEIYETWFGNGSLRGSQFGSTLRLVRWRLERRSGWRGGDVMEEGTTELDEPPI